MSTDTTYEIELSRDLLAKIVATFEDNELYSAITRAQAGDHIDDWLIAEWSQHWPIIDVDMCLTGESVDSDDPGNFANYDDRAMIDVDDARRAGWTINDGYASPPEVE